MNSAIIAALPFLFANNQATTLTIDVNGTKRTAIVHRQNSEKNSPVVMVFHGFTGTAAQAARSYALHSEWKEAIVVYPQGLNVKHPRQNRQGLGWQFAPGMEGNKDLKFVDEIVARIKKDYSADSKRFYACGMSNGALFTFQLFSERPQHFAAYASVGGAGGLFLGKAKTPRPFLIIFGKNDSVIPLTAAEISRDALLRINECKPDPIEWMPGFEKYPSFKGNFPVVWNVHNGGHNWPSDASKNIVKFFKEHRAP